MLRGIPVLGSPRRGAPGEDAYSPKPVREGRRPARSNADHPHSGLTDGRTEVQPMFIGIARFCASIQSVEDPAPSLHQHALGPMLLRKSPTQAGDAGPF